jgi:vacuolar-type H+-ATPase subunit C/Vma6
MNKVTLNSLFKSEIKVLENHRYRKYEQNLNTSALKPVSQIAPTIDHEKDCRNIKKLKT